jgi:spermidine synthase
MARKSFWCIVKTLESAGFTVKPYNTAVPSFGIWGFALAKLTPFDSPARPPANLDLRFLNDVTFASMFEFSTDTTRPEEAIEINRLDNQALVRYYEEEWRKFE